MSHSEDGLKGKPKHVDVTNIKCLICIFYTIKSCVRLSSNTHFLSIEI